MSSFVSGSPASRRRLAGLVGSSISILEELGAALDALKPHSPVVLQIERDGLLSFFTFEPE